MREWFRTTIRWDLANVQMICHGENSVLIDLYLEYTYIILVALPFYFDFENIGAAAAIFLIYLNCRKILIFKKSAKRMHTGILGHTHIFLLRVIFFFVNCAGVYFNIFFRFRRVGNYSRKCSNIKFQSKLRKLFFDYWNVTAQNTHTYCQCAYRICAVRFP